MSGTYEQLLRALQPLGEYKTDGSQLKFNCPRCEKELGNPIDKYNLEISLNKNACHCWACGLKGGLSFIIEKYGYADFAKLFKKDKKDNYKSQVEEKTLILPPNCGTVYNYPEIYDYLKSRGLTFEIIKERGILYCYDGNFKNNIIYPSYNKNGELVAFVSQNFYTKKYKKHLSSKFVCFYENFINKNSIIIITEGILDGLIVPNSLILLGTEINDKILDFLTDTNVLLILDADVNESLIESKIKQLLSTCSSVQSLILTEVQNDLNYFYVKNSKLLKKKLLPFYSE